MLLACLTGSSLPSAASTTRTVYLPFAAVQVPRLIGPTVAPALITPEYEPVRVRTTVPDSLSTVSVMPCAPDADATLPALRTDTEKVTVLPADGLPGDQATDEATRSDVATGLTTSGLGLE